MSPDTCGICSKKVANNHFAVCCDICNHWVNIKCNNITKFYYQKLEKDKAPWYCKKCISQVIPFSSLSKSQLDKVMIDKTLVSPKNLQKGKIINPNQEQENITHYDLLTPEEFNDLDIPISSSLYLHMNIVSLSYHIDDFKALVLNCPIKPTLIAISESGIRTNRQTLANIHLQEYTFEHTPTDSTTGGTLLYINNRIKYKLRNDLTLLKSKEIESTFIEVIEPSGKNKIFGCIYKHPMFL